jgi:hypothetical protein
VPIWARVSQLRQPWSRQYIHALLTFAIAYVAQPLSFSHAIHLGFHDLKAMTPRSAVTWSQKTVLFAFHFLIANLVDFYIHREFQKLNLDNRTLLGSFYFMTQFPLPYTYLRVATILYIFLLYFPALYRVTRKSPYTVLLLSQGTPQPPCILMVFHMYIKYALLIHLLICFISPFPYTLSFSNKEMCKGKGASSRKKEKFRSGEKIHFAPRFS